MVGPKNMKVVPGSIMYIHVNVFYFYVCLFWVTEFIFFPHWHRSRCRSVYCRISVIIFHSSYTSLTVSSSTLGRLDGVTCSSTSFINPWEFLLVAVEDLFGLVNLTTQMDGNGSAGSSASSFATSSSSVSACWRCCVPVFVHHLNPFCFGVLTFLGLEYDLQECSPFGNACCHFPPAARIAVSSSARLWKFSVRQRTLPVNAPHWGAVCPSSLEAWLDGSSPWTALAASGWLFKTGSILLAPCAIVRRKWLPKKKRRRYRQVPHPHPFLTRDW